MMNLKKIKRICGVRGCGNTAAFSISLTREHGNTVIMCKNCIDAAYAAAKSFNAEAEPNKRFDPAPPLFFETPVNKTAKTSVAEAAKKSADAVSGKKPAKAAGKSNKS